MTPEDEAVVSAAVPKVPRLASYEAGQLNISRLGGLTNLVYRVVLPTGEVLCLRVPGEGTEAYIDRSAEFSNASAAARAGVGPEVLHFGDDGLMLMPLLPGETMSSVAFASKAGAPARAGAALKKLHASGETFPGTFSLFEQIDKYLAELGENAILPDGYHEVLASAQEVRAALAVHPLPTAPCHCDPLSENFLDDGTRAWIVDFEYGGMNDPLWDLGDLCIEGALSPEGEEEFIGAYFGDETPPSPAERGRVVIYKAMCDLLWTLWGLLQHKNGNPAEDFWVYSLERFVRCRTLMASPGFSTAVAAVREG